MKPKQGKQGTYVDPEDLEFPDVEREPFLGAHESRDFGLVGKVNVRVLIAPANLVEIHVWVNLVRKQDHVTQIEGGCSNTPPSLCEVTPMSKKFNGFTVWRGK